MQGHSFDIARSGYTNLLQPQDRRSKNPGDTLQAVSSRRSLHDRGLARPLFEGISQLISATSTDKILDAGCGDGYYLGSLAAESNCKAHGVDISIPAIDAAARRYPGCEWIVANADRFIPYAGHFFSVLLSITGRMNPAEFHRVLQPDGHLLVALPAPDDLVELRGTSRDRVPRTVETFAPHFHLVRQERASTTADLSVEAVHDVLHSIYRPKTTTIPSGMRLTFSFDLLLFRPAPS